MNLLAASKYFSIKGKDNMIDCLIEDIIFANYD